MEVVQGRITRDGQLKIDNVEAYLDITQPTPHRLGEWQGYFVLPGLCYDVSLLEEGHLIELDDGRAGKIVITRLSPNDGGETTTVSFVGSGSIK